MNQSTEIKENKPDCQNSQLVSEKTRKFVRGQRLSRVLQFETQLKAGPDRFGVGGKSSGREAYAAF